jgi:hypothetical protein
MIFWGNLLQYTYYHLVEASKVILSSQHLPPNVESLSFGAQYIKAITEQIQKIISAKVYRAAIHRDIDQSVAQRNGDIIEIQSIHYIASILSKKRMERRCGFYLRIP